MKNRLNIHPLFTVGFALLILSATLLAGPVSLETNEVLELRALIRTNAATAAKFANLREVADRALGDKPDPIEKEISEGHLEKDPLKIRSEAAMKDINKTDCLGWDPKASITMFSIAAWFNPKYGKFAAKIDGRPNETFINWQMVINAISQRDQIRQ